MSMKVFCCSTRNLSEEGGGDAVASVDNRGSVNNGSGVDNGTDSMGNWVGNSMGNRDSLRVDSLAIVGDDGDVSIDVIGSVFNVLGAAVREGDTVRSSPGSSAVVSLGSLEVGAGVVVGNGVLVGEGRDLVGVHLGNGMGNRVGNRVGNNRGMVSGGSVDDRAGNGMGNRVGNAMSNNSVTKSVSNNSMGKSVSNNSMGNSVSNNSMGKSMTNNSMAGSVQDNSMGKSMT